MSSNEASAFEREDHLVDRRWGHAEVSLHFPFRRRPLMHARVGVDEGQILTLLGREGFCRVTHAGHPIQLFVRATK